jgi:hypothetical protein
MPETIHIPRLVTLVQCSKASCGHVLIEDEFEWICDPSASWGGSKQAVCPKCENESFYTLNALGQIRKARDESPREINPENISPSPRMGLKMKRRMLAAKRRALEICKVAEESK